MADRPSSSHAALGESTLSARYDRFTPKTDTCLLPQHIDYSLYEVLPMAITADFIMAVAVRPADEKPRIRIANLNSEKFPTREFEIPEGEIPIDSSEHEWSNYFKSGLKGVSELLQKKRGKFQSVGMDICLLYTSPSPRD